MRDDRAPWSVLFGVFAALAAAVLAMLLTRDSRLTPGDRLACWFAVGIAVAPLLVAVALRRQTAVPFVLGAAALSMPVGMTYEIGGLGFLVPALFLLAGAVTTRLARRTGSRPGVRATARVATVALGLLVVLSLFSPGGAAIVVVPVGAVLVLWARWVARSAGP